jgi:hypothetical protein
VKILNFSQFFSTAKKVCFFADIDFYGSRLFFRVLSPHRVGLSDKSGETAFTLIFENKNLSPKRISGADI